MLDDRQNYQRRNEAIAKVETRQPLRPVRTRSDDAPFIASGAARPCSGRWEARWVRAAMSASLSPPKGALFCQNRGGGGFGDRAATTSSSAYQSSPHVMLNLFQHPLPKVSCRCLSV